VSRERLDRRELFERGVLRPIFLMSAFAAGCVFGIGIDRADPWSVLLSLLMFAVFYACAESYWRKVYAGRLAVSRQVEHLRECVQAAYAWSDRWRSFALGHGDPWKGKDNADA